MISSILEVLEYAFTLSPNDDTEKNALRSTAIEVTSNLLTLPTPSTVQMHTFTLLAALHGSKSQYHAHKVSLFFIHLIHIYFKFLKKLICLEILERKENYILSLKTNYFNLIIFQFNFNRTKFC